MKMKIADGVPELIGSTPLLRAVRIEEKYRLDARILLKLECFNPAGSAKDRIALAMIEDAEKSGRLVPGGTVIEPTSGNTGIGLASVAASRGYRVVLTMPETMSVERRKLLAAYGAELVLTPGAEGMNGAVKRAEELAKEIPGAVIAGQFSNPANPNVHYMTTGPEIWEACGGEADVFVACVGTGGTFSGVSRFLKEKDPKIFTVAVEPSESPLITEGRAGPHGIQGIGANFIPENFDRTLADEVLTVTTDEAYCFGKEAARLEGVLLGISSGAALCAAVKLAERPENKGKTIVAVMPDTGERYLSTGMYD